MSTLLPLERSSSSAVITIARRPDFQSGPAWICSTCFLIHASEVARLAVVGVMDEVGDHHAGVRQGAGVDVAR